MDDVDLEEDSRKVKGKFKLWRRRVNEWFTGESGNRQSKRRRFSTFDFSKSVRNADSGVVASSVNLDALRKSEAKTEAKSDKRGSIEPTLAGSFTGGKEYGDGESPFFRESHGDMAPNSMTLNTTNI